MRTIILTLMAVLCLDHATAQDNRPSKYTFIRHDSIPMIFADSVVDFYGTKYAAKELSYRHKPLYYYAALTPAYPVTPVYTSFSKFPDEEQRKGPGCFRVSAGLILHCINYQAIINGDTVIIDSREKFREIFAPVESVQEAIAFAWIFTDSEPVYNLDFLDHGSGEDAYHKYEEIIETAGSDTIYPIRPAKPVSEWVITQTQPEIISSYAERVDDGYELLLYHYVVFGCSHPYMRRKVKVSFGGKVEIKNECESFRNLDDDGLCID